MILKQLFHHHRLNAEELARQHQRFGLVAVNHAGVMNETLFDERAVQMRVVAHFNPRPRASQVFITGNNVPSGDEHFPFAIVFGQTAERDFARLELELRKPGVPVVMFGALVPAFHIPDGTERDFGRVLRQARRRIAAVPRQQLIGILTVLNGPVDEVRHSFAQGRLIIGDHRQMHPAHRFRRQSTSLAR